LALRKCWELGSADPFQLVQGIKGAEPGAPERLAARRLFFLVSSWAFLGKGSSKTPQKYFCKKFMSKTFSEKIDQKIDVSFSRFRVFLSDGSSKTRPKTFYKKL
jgi:hypothetical protein